MSPILIILPWAKSHLHSTGPRPSHAFFNVQSSHLHLRWNSSSLGTNMTIPGQNYKYSSWAPLISFPSKVMESLHMPKEFNGLSDWVLSHWFPMEKSSEAGVGWKTGQWRSRGRGGAQLNEDIIQLGTFVFPNTNCRPPLPPTVNVNPTLYIIPCRNIWTLQTYIIIKIVTYYVVFHPNFNQPWQYLITSLTHATCWRFNFIYEWTPKLLARAQVVIHVIYFLTSTKVLPSTRYSIFHPHRQYLAFVALVLLVSCQLCYRLGCMAKRRLISTRIGWGLSHSLSIAAPVATNVFIAIVFIRSIFLWREQCPRRFSGHNRSRS